MGLCLAAGLLGCVIPVYIPSITHEPTATVANLLIDGAMSESSKIAQIAGFTNPVPTRGHPPAQSAYPGHAN